MSGLASSTEAAPQIFGGYLWGLQQYRDCPRDGGERGAQVVGHRPQDVLPDGDPLRLQLNGRLLGIEPLILLVKGFGLLLPPDRLGGLFLHPGGEGAHHAGDGHHGQHGYRVAGAAEGEGFVGLHKVNVDPQRPDDGGGNAIGVARGEQGDHGHRQNKDQGGVVLPAGVGNQDAAGIVGGAQKQGHNPQVSGNGRDAVALHVHPVVQVFQRLEGNHGPCPLVGCICGDYTKNPGKGKAQGGEMANLNGVETCCGRRRAQNTGTAEVCRAGFQTGGQERSQR